MKYDIMNELSNELSKEDIYVNIAERHYLRSISEKLVVANYKNLGDGNFEFTLRNGIILNIFFNKNRTIDHIMTLSTKISQYNMNNYQNINIKAIFNLNTCRTYHRLREYNSVIESKFEISMKLNEGYYIIEGNYKKEDKTGELILSYYDSEAVEYYKFRNGSNEFANPTSIELNNLGIIPDWSSAPQKYEDMFELLKVFTTYLSNPKESLKNIFEIMESKTKRTK